VKSTAIAYPPVRVESGPCKAVGQAGGVLLTKTITTAGLDPMPRSLFSGCAGLDWVEAEGGRGGVSGAGGLPGFFDPVAVVAGSFDRAGTAAFPPGREQQLSKIVQVGR
jgi:hypothetical protein